MTSFTINKKIEINAPTERVFSALTNSKEIPQYFPLQSVKSEWEVGKEVLYKGEVDDVSFTDFGVIETLSFPQTYRYRYWSDSHGTERTTENYLTITYQLEEISTGTLLTVVQNNIKSKDLYELMNNQVWDFLLSSLKSYVERNEEREVKY